MGVGFLFATFLGAAFLGAAFLATSKRSTPALATTFTARAERRETAEARTGAALTAETRETWATAIFLVCVLVCTRMAGARGRSRRWIAIVVQGRSWGAG